jgi:hypothetical protein
MKLNLTDFINQGVKTMTFKMDKEGNIFLTCKIIVCEGQDIIGMTMKSVAGYKDRSQSTKVVNKDEVDTSSSEEEIPGE